VTVCIGTLPLVPVSVMRCAAVCYSITETYDSDRLHCTKRTFVLAQPVVSPAVTAPTSTPYESC
jgi:hypothetical protein